MGRRTRSHTLPSSPTHSFSSSSDFEFTISLSPRKSSAANLCPADELFYKGQLLPLHLSPRISMVRTLLLASSSTSSSSGTTTASRDSTGSSNDSHSSFSSELLLRTPECDSSRPSSVTDQDDEYKRLNIHASSTRNNNSFKKPNKYFSLSRFSSVFRNKDNNDNTKAAARSSLEPESGSGSVKRMSNSAREVIRKYLKKVKPLYDKLSQNQKQQQLKSSKSANLTMCMMGLADDNDGSIKDGDRGNNNQRKENTRDDNNASISHSFSGNIRYPMGGKRRRKSCVSSCPSSMRSSPSHSGILSKNGFKTTGKSSHPAADWSSMEELQSAIQGAIAHCKNSMIQNN